MPRDEQLVPKLARRLKPEQLRGAVTMRQGVVDVVNADGTLDVTIGGSSVVIPGVARLASYSPTAGDTVWLLAVGPLRLVIGKLA